MRAVILQSFGGPERLQIGEWPRPAPSEHEILVKVAATALNRADILQRQGYYPPPKGESDIPGLEMAGTVVETGRAVRRWKKGDRICGLLAGGGYAEYAAIHEAMALPIPGSMSFVEAAAIPEVFLTAFQALRWLAYLKEKEWVLIHAGASGVGTAAIQLAKEMGAAQILVTASSGKHEVCRRLGATHAIDYKKVDFKEAVLDFSKERGVDVVIDFIGAPYLQRNLSVLRTDGRLILLALMGGVQPESFNIAPLLRKRLQITGSTLRARPLDYKIQLTEEFRAFAWRRFEQGSLQPVVDKVFDWTDAAEAHRFMEANLNKGKIVLVVDKESLE